MTKSAASSRNRARRNGVRTDLRRRRVVKALAGGGLGILASPWMFQTGRAQGRAIKIGFVSPQTGPIAAFGEADGFIVDGVRRALKDGITVAGAKHPVTIVVKDSQSNPSRAAEVTAALIDQDKCDIITGSSTSDTTIPVADQCEVNGVPCVTTDTPWEPWFFGRRGDPAKGFEWTYHFFWGAGDLYRVFLDLWESVPTNKVVGGLWSNDPDGNAVGDKERGFPVAIKKAGFTMVDAGHYPTMSEDFSRQIAQFKAQNVQIVTGVFVPPAWATFWAQAAQQNFKPKIATVAKALLFPPSVEALGERGAGMSTEIWWSPSHPYKSGLTGETSAQLAAAYTKATNRQWTQPLGFKHAGFEVVIDVLKRAKSLDPKAIRDAIKATNYQSIVGPVRWTDKPMKNCATTPLVGGQWKPAGTKKFNLVVVNNKQAPQIPVAGKFELLPG
jgi:branched-chain amino acid transport system substrate-binding protein